MDVPERIPTAPPPAGSRPLTHLVVLYDARDGSCARARARLEQEDLYLGLEFVPHDSARARRRFPHLSPVGGSDGLTVVGDGGQVWRGDDAWTVALWATVRWRRHVQAWIEAGETSRAWLVLGSAYATGLRRARCEGARRDRSDRGARTAGGAGAGRG